MLKARFKEVDKIRKKFFKFSGLKKKENKSMGSSICEIKQYLSLPNVYWNELLKLIYGLACCSSWGHKELETTERLN